MSSASITESSGDLSQRMYPSKLSVVGAVTRRLVPYLIEATLIPTVLFYAFLITLDLKWGIVAALGWCYAAVARRLVGRRPVPGLLVLGCLGITVRTAIYLLSGNAFVYFVQPILRTLVTAATFGVSVGSAGRSSPGLPATSAPSARSSRRGRHSCSCFGGSPFCGQESTPRPRRSA